MKKRILFSSVVSGNLSAAACVHAEDYDSQIAAQITQLVTLLLNKRLHMRVAGNPISSIYT